MFKNNPLNYFIQPYSAANDPNANHDNDQVSSSDVETIPNQHSD